MLVWFYCIRNEFLLFCCDATNLLIFYSVLDVPSTYNFDLVMQACGTVESWLCAADQYTLLTLF